MSAVGLLPDIATVRLDSGLIYAEGMCGRVIQSSSPLRLAIVDGLDVSNSGMGNFPPRYNAAPSQDLLVIRENHKTGERSLDPIKWGLIPYLLLPSKAVPNRVDPPIDGFPRSGVHFTFQSSERGGT